MKATVPGYIGFAVGRTTFWDPLMAVRDAKIPREVPAAEIGRRHSQWVNDVDTDQSATKGVDLTRASASADSIPLPDGPGRKAP